MAITHRAPKSLWAGAIGLDETNRGATAAGFAGIVRQGNTVHSAGPALFSAGAMCPDGGSGFLLFEQSGKGWQHCLRISVMRGSWDGVYMGDALTIYLDGGTLAYDRDDFDASRYLEVGLPAPIGDLLAWKIDWDNGVGKAVPTSWQVAAIPFTESDVGTLEGLGYIHEDRAAANCGVSRGTMQRLQNQIYESSRRPLAIGHVGFPVPYRVGKTTQWLTTPTPFFSTGRGLVLALRGISESAEKQVALFVDGAEIATVDGLPSGWAAEMQRSAVSDPLSVGWHTWAIQVRSLAANTDISSISVYEEIPI